jgi:hypothetical protein
VLTKLTVLTRKNAFLIFASVVFRAEGFRWNAGCALGFTESAAGRTGRRSKTHSRSSPIQENTSCILASGSAGSAKFGLIARRN